MLLSLLLASCGGSEAPKPSAPAAAPPPAKSESTPEGKSWGGWRWKGDRDQCFYTLGKRCFADLKSACAAAKCGTAACIHDDGAPASVTCKK